MDTLDPARTALALVHMAKGVAGEVDTPLPPLTAIGTVTGR